ncbi:E3 ubiquitin-protein ligase RNF168-like isoform X2 [Pieris brassicae]|uniref:E3 ubiquitin-protein ligase RNF168-like isoform X2 n=1 Tax=Pieris brassicae TaxID=7116 RepID=UPI001E65F736|nr:E3 ubiquitin-protein ligase RNF168-like isoform X2 [Pieris brassicae]
MAAKSKKRLSRNENKLNKLDKLEIKDVICSICQSILIEPVTLPCYHDFCENCFNGSIENNALCCPLCRLRIGSWVRKATKQKSLVNIQLWNFIQNKFSQEVHKKLNGEDIPLSPEQILPRLSKPGEIRSEYEAELERLRAERLKLEQDHFEETVVLIKKLKEEEEQTHKKYIESLKTDEMLAKKLQQDHTERLKNVQPSKITKKEKGSKKSRLKAATIDCYLSKLRPHQNTSTLDDTSADNTISKRASIKSTNKGQCKETIICENLNNAVENQAGQESIKENGKEVKDAKNPNSADTERNNKIITKPRNNMQSLLVSLPLPSAGILQHKNNTIDNRNIETGSVDSMQQELCYFKPIEATSSTSVKPNRGLPLRVPGVRINKDSNVTLNGPPSRAQYIERLCQLRQTSLAKKLPSAFVIALSLLKMKKDSPEKISTSLRSKRKNVPTSPVPIKKDRNVTRTRQANDADIKLPEDSETFLRRTRSMGSISKDNETTPKKRVTERKSESEKKPRLRSDTKKYSKKDTCLTSDTKLRIEKLIQQEKCDYELACKMDAEWNGRRQPRRAATKRQVSLNYALRPAKKLKV